MKPSLLVISACMTLTAAAQDQPKPEYKTSKEKISYGIGLNIGRSLKAQGMEVDTKILAAAINDILAGREPAVTEQDLQAAFAQYEAEKKQRNLTAAEKFLAENAKKEGVKTTKSGLQYKILKAGDGATPTAENTVSTHYRGRLLSGEVFDESFKEKDPTANEKPVSFPLNRVIPGWTEGLQLLKEGTTARLFIHPKMGYGEGGTPGIPPNSLLIFDITLLSVK